MKDAPQLHTIADATPHVCRICGNRYPNCLLEVHANGNWHPVCRDCLDDIGLAVYAPLTDGRIRSNRKAQCEGQGVLV